VIGLNCELEICAVFVDVIEFIDFVAFVSAMIFSSLL